MAGPRPQPPLYLARRSYRQRRIRDAVRMLPVVGAILWIMPIFYISPASSATGLYIFGVWTTLVVVAAVISSRIQFDQDEVEGAVSDHQDG